MIENINIQTPETDRTSLLTYDELDRLSKGIVNPSEWPDLSLVVESLDKLHSVDGGEIDKDMLAHIEDIVKVAYKIHLSIPELFEGRLHDEFQVKIQQGVGDAIIEARKRLPGLSSEPDSSLGGYVIGVNQTHVDQDSTIEEASRYLQTHGGVIAGDGFNNRFRAFSPQQVDGNRTIISQYIVSGYYVDTTYGKFVVAVPSLGAETPTIDFGLQWTDVYKDINNTTVVSSKYVAYYIDGEGMVWANSNYMIADEPKFVPLER